MFTFSNWRSRIIGTLVALAFVVAGIALTRAWDGVKHVMSDHTQLHFTIGGMNLIMEQNPQLAEEFQRRFVGTPAAAPAPPVAPAVTPTPPTPEPESGPTEPEP